MKKIKTHINIILIFAAMMLASTTSFAQTSKDTVKLSHPNDGMNVNPGTSNDPMVVKPVTPHDGMSILSDTGFLAKHIMDNKMEIQLSKLGQDKGTDPMTRKVAALLIKDHTALLNDLEKLNGAKTGNKANSHGETSMPPTSLPDGKEFDAAWAGQMLTMHEAKIAEMESFLSLTKNPALKAAVLKALPRIKAHRELLLKIPGAKIKSRSSQII